MKKLMSIAKKASTALAALALVVAGFVEGVECASSDPWSTISCGQGCLPVCRQPHFLAGHLCGQHRHPGTFCRQV